MTAGYPDWTRAIRLVGIDADGNPIAVLLDDDGRLYTLITGEDADGNPLPVLTDASGQIIMVPRGESGHYMAIDADGYMTAILKGDFAGALRTIGLDDDGRITVYLVDDESQWGDVVKTGNAELAARLGSPVAWDWRGKVIWWTDFRRGIGGMHKVEHGVDASVTSDPVHFLSGGYSVKLAGGASGGNYGSITVSVDVPPTPRVGVYIRWSSDSAFDYLNLQMQIYDGVRYHEAFIRYDKDDNEIDYINSDRVWQSLAAQKFHGVDYAWHGLKLVVDTGIEKYLRCLAGSTEHDMSALGMYNVASSSDQRLLCSVMVYSHAGNNEYAWIDAMVITAGEPE